MRETYPSTIILCSFLLVFGLTLFGVDESAIFGWMVGSLGGAGAVAAYMIGENRGK